MNMSLNDALFCDELWSLDNGVTLCWSCHKKMHENRVGFVLAGVRKHQRKP
jgi:hypothetical protein